MQGSSGLLLHPDRILKPALPSGSLSSSRALIASSLVLNEVIIERLRFTFTPNGKREFVPRDQVFPLFFVYCLMLLHKNK